MQTKQIVDTFQKRKFPKTCSTFFLLPIQCYFLIRILSHVKYLAITTSLSEEKKVFGKKKSQSFSLANALILFLTATTNEN